MRKFRLIVVGIVIGVAISIPLQAIAESLSKVGKEIEVEVPVSVDGEILSTPAIGLEGTTFIPVREAGERFGYEVGYDVEKKVVTLTSTEDRSTETEKGIEVEAEKSELEKFSDKSKGKTLEELQVDLDGWEGRQEIYENQVRAAQYMYDKDQTDENKQYLDEMTAKLEDAIRRVEIIKKEIAELEAQQ